jgi:Tfp pilus assembly protein PilN
MEQQAEEVAEEIDRLLTLVQDRSAWLEILDQVHARLPAGMWLTSLLPRTEIVEEKENGGDAPVEVISAIEISGMGYLDKVKSALPILEFRDRLRESEYFNQEQTEILLQPAPRPEDFAREFKILIVLEQPLKL